MFFVDINGTEGEWGFSFRLLTAHSPVTMSWLPLNLYKWRLSLSAKSEELFGVRHNDDMLNVPDEEQFISNLMVYHMKRKGSYKAHQCQRDDCRFKLGERAPPSNMVRTSNYTYFNFLPKFLYAQFKQVANLFFLVLSFIQTLPGLAPFGRQATIVPLSFIIGTSARRRVRDRKMNYQKCYAHTDDGWRMIPWCDVAVNGEQLAADCLILATSEPGSVAYVETANLDGEEQSQ
ncbi:hypothetical protein OSTOST_22599, partial [Ostertagia ostertagi]